MRPTATMIDHYNDLGFALRNDNDLQAVIERAFSAGRKLNCESGNYLVWRPGSDIELWVQTDRDDSIIGCMPHFMGLARVSLEIEEFVWVDTVDTALEGILSCYSCPDADGFAEDTGVPVLADSPDFGIVRQSLTCPTKVRAQLAAFAHEISCFSDEEEYEEAQQPELPPRPMGPEPEDPIERARKRIDRMTRAPESYFPLGQFSQPQTSRIGFAGSIRRTRRLSNPVTTQEFYHMVVKTYGGLVVDVVADPSMVKGTPVDSGILEGVCCLSARIEP